MDFDQAFEILIDPAHEGGYVDNPADPGGATRYGVTERLARAYGYQGDMRVYPLAEAKRVAKAQFWDAEHCDELPSAVRYDVFDFAYNAGDVRGVHLIQRAAGVADDGIFGDQTRRAIAGMNPLELKILFNAERLSYYASLDIFADFGRGWTRRVATNMRMVDPGAVKN